MRKPIIAAVIYTFPPMTSPRAVQVGRTLSGLPADVCVICGDDNLERKDPTMTPSSGGENDSIREIITLPYRRNQLLRKLDYIGYRASLSWSQVPDPQRRWAYSAGRELIARYDSSSLRPDAIITFGAPMSDHLSGLMYKRHTDVPWIAHLSDPWTDNPFRRDNIITRRLNLRMEKSVFEEADAVVFTSQETVNLVMKKYDRETRGKAFVLPHCYDADAYTGARPTGDGSYVIRLVGSLYAHRTPAPLFRAIERVAANEECLLHGVRIEIVGYIETRLKGMVQTYPASREIVSFRDSVPYNESLELMETAHCLLVIDAPADISVFFPSKLADYMGSGRYIFAITPRGTSEKIVRATGGSVADPSNDDEVYYKFKDILERRPDKLPGDTAPYEKKVVCRETMKLVARVMSQLY